MKRKAAPVFLIGAMKCGTTGLHDALLTHPNVHQGLLNVGQKLWRAKELHFFDTHQILRNFEHLQEKNLSTAATERRKLKAALEARLEYELLLPFVESSGVVVDATPAYLHMFTKVPHRIKNVYFGNWQTLRFVAVLRNPVDRALSHWKFAMQKIVDNHCGTRQVHARNQSQQYGGCWGDNLVNLDKRGNPANFTSVVQSEIRVYKSCLGNCSFNDLNCNDICAESGADAGIIDRGLYGSAFRHWMRFFEPQQFCIVSYDTFAGPEYAKLLGTVSRFILKPEPTHLQPSMSLQTARGDAKDALHILSSFVWRRPKRKNASPDPVDSKLKADMETATAILRRFYKSHGRSKLFDLVAKKGFIGCGESIVPLEQSNTHRSPYGWFNP
jgi:hypothetical protein